MMSFHTYSDASSKGVVYVRRGQRLAEESADSASFSWWSDLTPEERRAENERRSQRHASQSLRHYVRSGDLRRLLTFTNGADGEGWPTLREAKNCVMRWYRREGRALLGKTGFVCVPERGEGNRRIHVHAAIRVGYFIDYSAIIRSWSAHLVTEGYISTANFHRFHAGDDHGKHKKAFSSARICAGYLAKYMTKGFREEERVKNERRFESADCFPPEPVRVGGFRLSEASDMVGGYFGCDTELVPFYDFEGKLAGYWFDTGEVKRCTRLNSGR